MLRFMMVTFAFLGLAFYELSGGADYSPTAGSRQAVALNQPKTIKTAKISPAIVAVPKVQSAPAAVITLASAPANIASGSAIQKSGKTFIAANIITPVVSNVALDTVKAINLTAPISETKTVPVVIDITTSAPAENTSDIRQVTGNRVNMRLGPSTDFGVAAKLASGTRVEVIADNGNGWLNLRVVSDDTTGWMADWLVSAAAN